MTLTPMTNERITSYSHDGLRFDVLDEGPLDGVPVVLLHGFPERASSWAAVSARLHEQGLRTIAPDQRGYSPGARPRRRHDYRIEALVADVAALIQRVGAPVHVVGHDWGSVVAWFLASGHPDLVRTLTSVSVPHPAAFLAAMLRSSQAVRSRYILTFQVPGLVETVARRVPRLFERGLRRSGMTDDDVARCRREMIEYGALPGALGWYRALPFVPAGWARRPVTIATTHVWSDGDTALTRKSAELTKDWARGPYVLEILEGVSHWIPTHAPDELAEIILCRIASVGDRPTDRGPTP